MARKHNGWQISAAVILFIIAVVAAGLLMWCLLEGRRNVPLILMGVAVLAFSVFGAFWYIAGPDRIKAKNTSRMLTLANQMLGAMEGEGLTANLSLIHI